MLTIQFGNDAVSVPKSCLIPNAGLIELRVLLVLCAERSLRERYPESAEEIAREAGCETGAVHAAVAFWRGAGMMETTSLPAEAVPSHTVRADKALLSEQMPDYSGEELKALEDKSEGRLRTLIDSAEEILGKMFNETEIGKIAALSDYLRLEDEFILLLLQYCAGQGKKSVPYVIKTAYSLFNDGIDDYPKLDAYIKYREKYNCTVSRLRRMCGIGERALTKKENGIVRGWIEEEDTPFEVLQAAYDTTVDSIGKMSFEYMDKVLATWRAAGVKTEDDAEKCKAEFRRQRKEAKETESSFDTDEFFEAALKRSYEILNIGGGK